jgi:hypothetical protein
MKSTSRIVYAMHIVNENEGAEFPEIFIDLSEPIGFSNMTVSDLWRSINNRYIKNKNFQDSYEQIRYYNNISIEFWIAERIEGHGVYCLQRNCKLLHKIADFNAEKCIMYTSSSFRFLMETMFNKYPETKDDVPPAKFNTVI